MRSKLLLSLLAVLFTLIIIVVPANAQEKAEFSAGFDVSYTVAENGSTTVNQKISLTNLTDSFYAKEYNLSIGSAKITNASATDSGGKIKTDVKQDDKKTDISLLFNDKVIGKGRSLNFSLNYEVSDVATKNGLIWEVNIPKLQISADIQSYTLRLKVPQSFGEVHYLSPNPVDTQDGKERTYVFSREQLETNGVSAAFGKFQIYHFSLKYHLQNQNIFKANAQIALPPDTTTQQVILDSLDPVPSKIDIDQDGNYLATYQVGGRQKLEITAKGSIKVVEAHRQLQTLAEELGPNHKEYLATNRYWNNDPVIFEKAKELTSDLPTSDAKAKAIYDYVTTYLSYDYKRLQQPKIERLGAIGAINNPKNAICMEYTDLFIALARAAGIPTREVDGYAYSQDQSLRPTTIGGQVSSDVLHAWPEYYSFESKRWFQIDPTWGSTTKGVDYFNKLDTNHIVFVRKGHSAEEPLPAGAYKLETSGTGDVDIKAGGEDRTEDPKIEISLKSGSVPSGFSSNTIFTVKNTGKRALFSGLIRLDEPSLQEIESSQGVFGTLLPFSTKEVTFKIKSSSLFSNNDLNLFGELSGSDGQKEIKVPVSAQVHLRPFFTFGFLPFFFTILLIFILISVILLLKREMRSFKKPV